jgi:hypothetical protein
MALTPEGFLMYVPEKLADDQAKDKFAQTARLIATGYDARGVAMILESWMTFPKNLSDGLPDVPPSQSPDREEVVVVMAESRDVCKQRFLFIQRNSLGKFIGFSTSPLPEFDDMQGRFARIIPPKIPSKNDALMARSLLKVMGVDLSHRGQNPMWN